MCRIAFFPLNKVHNLAGAGSFCKLYACCVNKYSKFVGNKCLRSLITADSIKICLASSMYPCAISHLGEFGIHLQKID